VLAKVRSPSDVALFCEIFVFAAIVPVLLMLLQLDRVQRLLEPRHVSVSSKPATIKQIRRYVDFILFVGRPIVRRRCLTRALTLYYFLKRAGMDVTVCFGMGTIEGEYVGHCWLVKEGAPFLERRDPRLRYTPVYSFHQTTEPMKWAKDLVH